MDSFSYKELIFVSNILELNSGRYTNRPWQHTSLQNNRKTYPIENKRRMKIFFL